MESSDVSDEVHVVTGVVTRAATAAPLSLLAEGVAER